jgi:hypothetical protein
MKHFIHTLEIFVVSSCFNDQNAYVSIFGESACNGTSCSASPRDNVVLQVGISILLLRLIDLLYIRILILTSYPYRLNEYFCVNV